MRQSLLRVGVSFALWAAWVCGPCAGATAPAPPTPAGSSRAERPSLLLVTIDTWRWDCIGASGSGRVRTPNLDRLARGGVYEREAVTSCPLTTPAHASILTGLNPTRHGVWDCTSYPLPEGVPTLAERFRAAGFATGAFVASETLNRRYGLARGFGVYDDVALRQGKSEAWWTASRDGASVADAFLAFLKSQPPRGEVFAWVHFYDAHLPYRPRPGFDERYPKDPYSAQVAYIDEQVGRLLSALEAGGRSWRVVVVGDHGEGLGDRGEATHGIGLYRSTLHVPLILYPKPEKPLLHPRPWGLVDIAPTILEWYGLAGGGGGDGESLYGGGAPGRALYAASLLPTLFFGVAPSVGVRRGPDLYLRYSTEELYDLETDPAQRRDLRRAPEANSTREALRGLCDREWPQGWSARVLPAAPHAGGEGLEALRGLGYISGAIPTGATLQGAPIGQLLKDHSDWEAAREEAAASGRSDRLLALFPGLVARYPNSFALRKDYGTTLAKSGREREAVDQLERAARLFPGDSVVLENLGALYLAQGRVEAARIALERSVQIDPDHPGAQKNLGILYLDHLKQPDRAIPHFKKYLEAGGDAEAEQVRAFILKYERTGPPPTR